MISTDFNFGSPGTSETIAGLTSASASSEVDGDNSTLTLSGAGTYAYAGELLDGGTAQTALTVLKSGSGTEEFDGTNTYAGGTHL